MMMKFSQEPTARGDEIAAEVRTWYEANRESWWDRHRPGADRKGWHADEFMLSFVNEVRRLLDEERLQKMKQKEDDEFIAHMEAKFE
jgi:hypothetical protein